MYFKNENISSGLAQTTGILKMTPVLERMTLGLYTSVLGSQTKTASTPTASQVRKIAPKLPGFSRDSKTTTKGSLDNFKSFKASKGVLITARIPSWRWP